jgi:hypothetical protein
MRIPDESDRKPTAVPEQAEVGVQVVQRFILAGF